MAEFSENLQRILKSRNIHQSDLAKLLEISPSTISKWINGDRLPSFELLIKLCQILNINPASLIINMEKGVKGKIQCGSKEYCCDCKVFKCRILERNTQNCSQCIRRFGCMRCLKDNDRM